MRLGLIIFLSFYFVLGLQGAKFNFSYERVELEKELLQIQKQLKKHRDNADQEKIAFDSYGLASNAIFLDPKLNSIEKSKAHLELDKRANDARVIDRHCVAQLDLKITLEKHRVLEKELEQLAVLEAQASQEAKELLAQPKADCPRAEQGALKSAFQDGETKEESAERAETEPDSMQKMIVRIQEARVKVARCSEDFLKTRNSVDKYFRGLNKVKLARNSQKTLEDEFVDDFRGDLSSIPALPTLLAKDVQVIDKHLAAQADIKLAPIPKQTSRGKSVQDSVPVSALNLSHGQEPHIWSEVASTADPARKQPLQKPSSSLLSSLPWKSAAIGAVVFGFVYYFIVQNKKASSFGSN